MGGDYRSAEALRHPESSAALVESSAAAFKIKRYPTQSRALRRRKIKHPVLFPAAG
jgi:hypothetical protein